MLWAMALCWPFNPGWAAMNHNRWLLILILGMIGVFYTLLVVGFFYAFMCGKEEQSQIRQKLSRQKA